MNNINDSYFDGYYKEIWRTLIPDELTVKEVDFMLPYFKLVPGSKVLDLMCGYGRHTLALARKGLEVTAFDNLSGYIDEIEQAATKEGLRIMPVQSNVLDFTTDQRFDLAICMGNSLNFFNVEDATKLLANISLHLKKSGHLLINTWSIAEIAIRNFTERGWSQVGDLKFLTESKYLFHPTRIEIEHQIIAPDGATEIKTGIDYIYSINEMEGMLNKAGLVLKEVYSIPGKKKFVLGEPRAYIVAEKT